MTRISKKGERRHQSPRKNKPPFPKTGPKKDAISFRKHENSFENSENIFIPKM